MALRQGSATLLRDALLAYAICQVVRAGDDRDVMVDLAIFYFVAQQVGLVPSDLFGEIASYLPDGWVPDLLRPAPCAVIRSCPSRQARYVVDLD
jgi:hypothetical protein